MQNSIDRNMMDDLMVTTLAGKRSCKILGQIRSVLGFELCFPNVLFVHRDFEGFSVERDGDVGCRIALISMGCSGQGSMECFP